MGDRLWGVTKHFRKKLYLQKNRKISIKQSQILDRNMNKTDGNK